MFLNSWCTRGGFNTLRYFFDLSQRVEVIVSFPRLCMFPPRLCISAMRPGVKYVADRVKLLPDGEASLSQTSFSSHLIFSFNLELKGLLFLGAITNSKFMWA